MLSTLMPRRSLVIKFRNIKSSVTKLLKFVGKGYWQKKCLLINYAGELNQFFDLSCEANLVQQGKNITINRYQVNGCLLYEVRINYDNDIANDELKQLLKSCGIKKIKKAIFIMNAEQILQAKYNYCANLLSHLKQQLSLKKLYLELVGLNQLKGYDAFIHVNKLTDHDFSLELKHNQTALQQLSDKLARHKIQSIQAQTDNFVIIKLVYFYHQLILLHEKCAILCKHFTDIKGVYYHCANVQSTSLNIYCINGFSNNNIFSSIINSIKHQCLVFTLLMISVALIIASISIWQRRHDLLTFKHNMEELAHATMINKPYYSILQLQKIYETLYTKSDVYEPTWSAITIFRDKKLCANMDKVFMFGMNKYFSESLFTNAIHDKYNYTKKELINDLVYPQGIAVAQLQNLQRQWMQVNHIHDANVSFSHVIKAYLLHNQYQYYLDWLLKHNHYQPIINNNLQNMDELFNGVLASANSQLIIPDPTTVFTSNWSNKHEWQAAYWQQGFDDIVHPLLLRRIAALPVADYYGGNNFTNRLLQSLLAQYQQTYLSFWHQWIADLKPVPLQNNEQLKQWLHNSTDSPASISELLHFIKQLDIASLSMEHFKTLDKLSQSHIDAYQDNMLTLAKQVPTQSPYSSEQDQSFIKAVIDKDIQNPLISLAISAEQLTQTIHQPTLRHSINSLLNHIHESIWQVLIKDIVSEWQQSWQLNIVRLWQKQYGSLYPFNTNGNDLSINQLNEFLMPIHGQLWAFANTSVIPFIDKKQSAWQVKSSFQLSMPIEQKFIDVLYHLQLLTDALYSDDGKLGFHYQIYPQSSNGISEVVLQVDKQKFLYQNGPQEWIDFSWPAKGMLSETHFILYDLNQQIINQYYFTGPWGILHLLDKAKLEIVDTQTLRAIFRVDDGHSTSLLIKSSGKHNPFILLQQGLKLPQNLVKLEFFKGENL